MEVIKEEERIDDLEYKGLKIIQNKNGFCFGIDSILLSDFAKDIKKDAKVIDLGTGTGILSILLSVKTDLKKVYGIEVQEEVAQMASRSVLLNHLEEKVEVIHANIKNIEKHLEKETFDAIVTNPPYKKIDTGITNESENKKIARHEIEANLKDFIEISFKMLKDKGTLYMVHRTERLVDILYEMRQHKIEPKEIRFIHSKIGTKPILVLIKAIKNGKSFLKVREPLYIYENNGDYTQEILKIYHKI